ncbi:hypothetical protein QTP88_018613 [Uroleucon formosanum]
MRYAKANHEKAPDFDSRKSNAWLVYQDCNNLYGWAMSEYMPFGDFKWVEPSLSGLDDLDDTSPIGRIYEVDVIYPQELHDHHNDLPFLPENGIPAGSKVKKLMETFESKNILCITVHRVLQFKQSPWLAEYISMNTKMRKMATNDFEKEFFKLMNNAVFGKTMESVRKRIKIELVSCPRRFQKLVNKSTFKHATTEDEPDDVWSELDSEVDAEGMKWSEQDKDLMRGLLHHTSNLS